VAEISYVLVQSREVATAEETGYLAVVSEEGIVPTPRPTGAVPQDELDRVVTCRDASGGTFEFSRSQLNFLPINGFLTELAFIDKAEKELPIYPEFSMDNFDYAIVGSSFDEIGIKYTAIEGFAAKVFLENRATAIPSMVIGNTLRVGEGANTLVVSVSSIDGTSREYTLHLLNGQDSEGFRKKTLSKFPVSYADGLWLLHCLHPDYRFEPYSTGLSFEEVLNNEDKGSRSLISATYNPTWVKPGSPVYDGSSWKAAKREVVAYFLDPRNFLTPTGIFQFEKLSFDESVHTLDGISAMTKNSFLNETDPDYASILLKAGRDAGVSPYFLTSRILQEMGRNGESKLAHGTLDGYEGYFNFYNIGSTPDPSVKNGALINGAKYAKYGSKPEEKQITPDEELLLLPWTTPEKAICGGALWIARSYIEIGQDTLYFQKFDIVDNEDGMYNHQYAQNIAMANNEGVRYYTAYASQDMLDSSFVFIIPIYENLPAEFGKSPI
jgi:beta-N-acetylglucosaminidase